MKKLQAKINIRFVAAMLVTAAVVGVSALASIHSKPKLLGSFLEEYSD
jgi:hypothetical protein